MRDRVRGKDFSHALSRSRRFQPPKESIEPRRDRFRELHFHQLSGGDAGCLVPGRTILMGAVLGSPQRFFCQFVFIGQLETPIKIDQMSADGRALLPHRGIVTQESNFASPVAREAVLLPTTKR